MQKKIPCNVDAFEVFQRVARNPGVFFLDSNTASLQQKRSFIGCQPIEVFKGKNLQGLAAMLSCQRRNKALAVGYITYEGSFHFGLYPSWIEIDHSRNTLILNAKTAVQLKQLEGIIHAEVPYARKYRRQTLFFKSNFDKARYIMAVKKALAAIKRGDIYQINLSRAIEASISVDPIALYASLRKLSPSPLAAYYDDGQVQILSSSPERFLRLNNGIVQVKPMKGTRARGETASEDKRLRDDLLHSAKEKAELLMVTDLERNDLGRVCDYGSVKVKAMRTIETYKTVFQATATIEGKLHKSFSALDLIKATFPSGSVTGCPKISAMKYIKQIEQQPRGFYTGTLGYIDPQGNMDLSVLIRSMCVTKNNVRFHVGGGIVADSKPALEYAETILKAKAMTQALAAVTRNNVIARRRSRRGKL